MQTLSPHADLNSSYLPSRTAVALLAARTVGEDGRGLTRIRCAWLEHLLLFPDVQLLKIFAMINPQKPTGLKILCEGVLSAFEFFFDM